MGKSLFSSTSDVNDEIKAKTQSVVISRDRNGGTRSEEEKEEEEVVCVCGYGNTR